MKKNSLFLLGVAGVAALLISLGACKKDRVPQDDYQNMDSFYNDNQEEEQELQVDSGSGSCYVTAKKGTRICITRDELRTANDSDITSYPFQLKVIELYSIKDMILRRQPSVAADTILETSAEIKVRPFKDGNEVYLKSGRAYSLLTDTLLSTTSGMQAYYGYENSSMNEWTDNLSSIIPGFVDTLSSVAPVAGFYSITPATTGYVSAAQPHQSTAQYTHVTFSVTGTNTQNIQIFISFHNFKSVMKVENLISKPIPIGETVTLVAFAKKQTNDYVLDQQTFIVGFGQAITLNMQVVTEANLLTALGAL